MSRTNVLGVEFDNVTMQEAVERALELLTYEADREILKNALEIYQNYRKTIA